MDTRDPVRQWLAEIAKLHAQLAAAEAFCEDLHADGEAPTAEVRRSLVEECHLTQRRLRTLEQRIDAFQVASVAAARPSAPRRRCLPAILRSR